MYSVDDAVAVTVVYSENNAHRERKNIIITQPVSQLKGVKIVYDTHPKKIEQRDVKQWEKVSVIF